MSYFSELQGYMNNLQEGQNHEQQINAEAVDEKTKTIEDKFNAITQQAEGWGGAIAQGGILWKHGRKVMQKIADRKSGAGDSAGGDSAGGDSAGAGGAGDSAGAGGAAEHVANQSVNAAPAEDFTQAEQAARAAVSAGKAPVASGAGAGETGAGGAAEEAVQQTGGGIRIAGQAALDPSARTQFEPSARTFGTTEQSTAGEFGQATETNIAQNLRSVQTFGGRLVGNGGNTSGSAASGEQASSSLAENAAGGGSEAANSGGSSIGDFLSGVNKLVQGTKTAASQLSGAGGDAVGDITTTLTGAGGGGAGASEAIAGGLAAIGGADAIPIVGGIIGIGTMIGGLIHELHKSHEEAQEQRATDDGGTTARTGIDTSSAVAGGSGSAVGSYIA